MVTDSFLVRVFSILLLVSGAELVAAQDATATAAKPTYAAKVEPGSIPPAPQIKLPNLDSFTSDAILSQVPTNFAGQATVGPTAGEACLSECFDGKRSIPFKKMQGTDETRVIKLSGGALTLSQVVKQIADPAIIETAGADTILNLPLLVASDATLVIRGAETPKVRLATKTGVFLANAGTLFVLDATVSSWEGETKSPTPFSNAEQFRPFVASYASSKTHTAGCTFQHLGYGAPSSYGFTLTSHPRRHTAEDAGNWPTGSLVKNKFEGLYYGFYSFEARDVAIVENHYVKSVRYGIDPHDRSTRLIIAKNIAEGTVERHGIIGSRGVSNSFIFDNISRKNAKSGIMLDRKCFGNLIVNNRVYDNGNGIALYESSNNQLLDNLIAFNNGTGIRTRNSTDVLIQNNTIVGNSSFAVTCEGRRLDDHDKRFERGDTYETVAAATVYSNVVAGNSDGLFKGANFRSLCVGGLTQTIDLAELAAQTESEERQLPMTDNDPFGGDLEDYEMDFQAVLRSDEKVLNITRTSESL